MKDFCCDKEDKVSPSATETETVIRTCSAVFEMTGGDVLVGGFVEQEESSIMDSQAKASSKWTNAKHSLYLKSIEASFVDQLYNSLDMQTYQPQTSCRSDAISTWKSNLNTYIPSNQLKIHQRGCWSKKRFNRENSHMKDADKPRVSPPSNPWIQHFINGSFKRPSSTATALQYPVADSQLDQELGCSNTEVTGQNFVEESQYSRKRVRTSKHVHSSNDQVVPNYTAASETPDSYVSANKLGSISYS